MVVNTFCVSLVSSIWARHSHESPLITCTVSMPELIAQTNMDIQAVNRLREELSSMTTWLAKEPQVNAYFSSVYESPGQAYIDKVKSST
jgi:mortality factor 4-like protein 1